MSVAPEEGTARSTSTAPAQAGLVLVALILVAAVANLNLAVANVALPDIGAAFQSSQTTLNLIAVGYSLGLACSVLYFGALGDRYGRKAMLVIGTALAIPMSLLAAWAPTDIVLFIGPSRLWVHSCRDSSSSTSGGARCSSSRCPSPSSR